jgi:1,4-alpha-glucan branching enzyme
VIVTTVATLEIARIVHWDHHDPFQVLGAHTVEKSGKRIVVVRAYLPDTAHAWVVDRSSADGKEYPMERITEEGFFEAAIEDRSTVFPYLLRKKLKNGRDIVEYDPYSFWPTLSDFDLYLFNKGEHYEIYEKLGAHTKELNGVTGVQFAVWAPNARSVSVVGDFNEWDPRRNAMRVLGSSGVWEIFVPQAREGHLYKFLIKTQDGRVLEKTDPFAFEKELRPKNAARVNSLGGFEWTDNEWMAQRAARNSLESPIAVYEVHPGSWVRRTEEGHRWLTYRELAHELVHYVTQRGFTHIELLPVMEHPFDGSWGYQVTGYFAPTSRFGSPQDFMYFVNHCHRNNIGVILDWVPAHFPRDRHALGEFDGTHLYEHADPRKGEHQDWGTFIFNYGRMEVKNFLISNALFWLRKYHIDGLRIDAVASMLYLDYSRKPGEWIPNRFGGRENLEAIDFLRHLNSVVHEYFPSVLTFAEESTAWPGVTAPVEYGGLGFDFKWNMGWMHDVLTYFQQDPLFRSYHHDKLTFVLLYAFSEKFLLPLSHDEVVHGKASLIGKMPGDDWQKFANLRLLYGLMYAFPGKKLLFMGSEFAQWSEWNHDAQLEWHLLQYDRHRQVQRWIDDLNRVYRSQSALHRWDCRAEGFEWIDFQDRASSIIAFLRKSSSTSPIVVVCNFTPVPRESYRIGVPEEGKYREILNSDSAFYGGSNLGNAGEVRSERISVHGRPFSLPLKLPPLAILYLQKISSE